MNIVKINNIRYKFESLWRDSKNTIDDNNMKFPYPEQKDYWYGKNVFLHKLKYLQNSLKKNNKFTKYNETKDCLLCKETDITTGNFTLNNVKWEDGLYHYIKIHNVHPSEEFKDIIYQYKNKTYKVDTKIARINATIKKSKNIIYLKLTRNQILIMDALMVHGGNTKRYHGSDNKLKYSEHAGLIDFNNRGVDKIIIYGNTNRINANDSDILLPVATLESLDYEYIFHTHPPTPKPGGRVKNGILYELPSIGDIFHFIKHYNDGVTQGSIIVAAEGMYIIRAKNLDVKKIVIDENKLFETIKKTYFRIQNKAIEIHTDSFTNNYFYTKIASDTSFINEINDDFSDHGIHIDYYPRILVDGQWIIDTVYLPVKPIEIS